MDNEKSQPSIDLLIPPPDPPDEGILGDPRNNFTGLISSTMAELTKPQLEEALGDLHGIAREVSENEYLISSSISSMQETVRNLDPKAMEALTMASKLSFEYVNNSCSKLKFLRSTDFNPQLAAYRLAGYFAVKLELFGRDKLVEDIQLSDLDDLDTQCINSRYFYLLEKRDQAGRAVICCWPRHQEELPTSVQIKNKLKALWSIVMTAIEDVDVQKRGAVFVYFNESDINTTTVETLWKTCRLLRCLPIRILGLHYCHNSIEVHQPLINAFVMALDARLRARFRVHKGTTIECHLSLRTHGIPSHIFVAAESHKCSEKTEEDYETTVKKQSENVTAGIGTKKVIAEKKPSPKKQSRVTDIVSNDVLFGRGKAIQSHPGNRIFRELVEHRISEYEAASRLEKTLIAEEIARKAKEAGSRFLKQEADGWYEVDDELARDKIAHAFRTRRKTWVSKADQMSAKADPASPSRGSER